MKKSYLSIIFILFCTPFIFDNFLHAQQEGDTTAKMQTTNKKFDFSIRYGQGGFSDERSHLGVLGGGQINLDVKLKRYPLAISIFAEYYTNGPEPTHHYEISDLWGINILYIIKPFKTERVKIFTGGGMGQLFIPSDELNSDNLENTVMYNMEAGINVKVFWKTGLYASYKYLYAMDEEKLIDFNEHIGLLGITFNFSL